MEGARSPNRLEGRSALWVPVGVGQAPRSASPRTRALRVGRRLLRRLPGNLGEKTGSARVTLVDPCSYNPEAGQTIVAMDGSDLCRPPDYVRRLAAEHGVSLEGRWRVLPPRGYRQQKVVLLVETDDGLVAVKVTQHPSVNRRLLNEYNGLRHAWTRELVPRETLPQPMFEGGHAGLLVVGEEGIRGTDFARHCDAGVRHPLAEAMVAWIQQLGQRSRHEVPGEAAGVALDDLATRLSDVYRDSTVAAVLKRDARLIGDAGTIPAVFMHGDAGHWNTLVRSGSDRIAVLDWENAEASGLPTWDLVHFVQTYGAWHAERRGIRYTDRVFARQLLDPASAWHTWLVEALTHHAEDIGLDPDLLWPLARARWGFEALKESTRRPARKLAAARAYRVLRAAVAQSALDHRRTSQRWSTRGRP